MQDDSNPHHHISSPSPNPVGCLLILLPSGLPPLLPLSLANHTPFIPDNLSPPLIGKHISIRNMAFHFNAKITVQKLALLSFEQSDGITLEPPYQEPYSKWYVLDLVVRDNPQNLDAKTIIDNL